MPTDTPVLGDPDAVWRAAIGFDVEALRRAIDEAFALGEVEQVIDGWLLPSLHNLGLAWARGEVNVAEEHFASASLHRRLAAIFEATTHEEGSPRVLIGLAAGSRHELGVLAFATVLARTGVEVIYLGGDVPARAWIEAVSQRTPDGVVIAVPSQEDVPACRDLVDALSTELPGISLLAGGSHQEMLDERVTKLGHHILTAAARLSAAVKAKV